jgi:hypothetical protein
VEIPEVPLVLHGQTRAANARHSNRPVISKGPAEFRASSVGGY